MSARRAWQCSISAWPGRKTRRSPSCSERARRTTLAVAAAISREVDVSLMRSLSARSMATGNDRPSHDRTLHPRDFDSHAVSIVADMMTRRSSGRNIRWVARSMASASSVYMLRSWNSSKMTAETPSRVGSEIIMRHRMPSVTTSMRVAADVRLSILILYPTLLPVSSPDISAIRSAMLRAAMRLGSSMMMRPEGASRSSHSSMVSGRRVDLPAPGGAVTITTDAIASSLLSEPAMA